MEVCKDFAEQICRFLKWPYLKTPHDSRFMWLQGTLEIVYDRGAEDKGKYPNTTQQEAERIVSSWGTSEALTVLPKLDACSECGSTRVVHLETCSLYNENDKRVEEELIKSENTDEKIQVSIQEVINLNKFVTAHGRIHNSDLLIVVRNADGGGIGTRTLVKCGTCETEQDITDYSRW